MPIFKSSGGCFSDYCHIFFVREITENVAYANYPDHAGGNVSRSALSIDSWMTLLNYLLAY
jgi:hypothetical protein